MYIRLTGDCKLYIDVSLNIVCLSELAQQQTLNSSWVYYTFCQLENAPALAELDKWRKMGCIFFLDSYTLTYLTAGVIEGLNFHPLSSACPVHSERDWVHPQQVAGLQVSLLVS